MAADETTENGPPLWQMTSLTDFTLPPAPARETAAKGLAALWRLIRNRNQPQRISEKTDDQLQTLSDAMLDQIVPSVDWMPGAAALDEFLSNWPGQDYQRSPIRFIIGPPYSGHGAVLMAWAKQRQTPIIASPTSEQILAQDKKWLSAYPNHDQPWMLPNLERCFFRHADGLTLIRRFLERALSGRLGFGVVGCDSWGWRYLQKVWAGSLAGAYTLQAFDSERLSRYLSASMTLQTDATLCFREVGNGRDVLLTNAQDTTDATPTSSFLKHLAAQSRGNLGVACEYWRASLCEGPDGQPESEPEGESPEDANPRKTIWLKTGLKEPELPPVPTLEVAFVLHALLIHNGLPADVLAALLPLSRDTVFATLFKLAAERLVEADDHVWRVSALGYPMVRRFLKNNGYMIDSF